MKCPHCTLEVNPDFREVYLQDDLQGHHSVFKMLCPNKDCNRFILKYGHGENGTKVRSGQSYATEVTKEFYFLPMSSSRPVPEEVEEIFKSDFNEACLILGFSPKASAALSRRCLQHILREKAGVKPANLYDEIQEVLDTGALPSYLSEDVDSIRHIGNFASHPTKSSSSGEIVDVEVGEAEWNLDVLEGLFDFYFVQPKKRELKKEALNQKLLDAGKNPMK